MPRQPRLDLPGYVYHVIIRGIEGKSIFRDRNDYEVFLARLEKTLTESRSGKCYAWVLMTNHAHFLLRSGEYGLAAMMRPLLTGYAVCFNRKYKRNGHLFQNRYKSTLCNADEYLMALVRYIHFNPVKAGIVPDVRRLADYPWSGHAVMMGRINRPWQDADEILGLFGESVRTARKRYEEFMSQDDASGNDLEGGGLVRSCGGMTNVLASRAAHAPELSDARVLGNGEFVKEVLDLKESCEVSKDKNKITLSDIIARVADRYGVDPAAITGGNRGRLVSQARHMVTCVSVVKYGIKQSVLANELSLTHSSISKILSRSCFLHDRVLEEAKRLGF